MSGLETRSVSEAPATKPEASHQRMSPSMPRKKHQRPSATTAALGTSLIATRPITSVGR